MCGAIPGLVYNPSLDQCAWPDEVGCSLRDLGYSSGLCGNDIFGSDAFDLKEADFQVELPEGRAQNQVGKTYYINSHTN